MAQPEIVVSLLGKASLDDGRRIVATVHENSAWPKSDPNSEQTAKRIADCVTAFAGVADRATFMRDVRALPLRYAKGEDHDDPQFDPHLTGLLARCIRPETLMDEEEYRDPDPD